MKSRILEVAVWGALTGFFLVILFVWVVRP